MFHVEYFFFAFQVFTFIGSKIQAGPFAISWVCLSWWVCNGTVIGFTAGKMEFDLQADSTELYGCVFFHQLRFTVWTIYIVTRIRRLHRMSFAAQLLWLWPFPA